MPSSPQIVVEPRPTGTGRRPKPPAPPSPEPADPAKPKSPRKPRRVLRVLGGLLLALLLWCLWAAYALYDFAGALNSEDAVALERRVEWAPVRLGLRDDLRLMLGSRQFGEPASDRTVDPLTTQRAVVSLIRAARFNDRGWDITTPPAADAKPDQKQDSPADRGFDLLRINYAFFSGSPFALRVDVRPGSDTVKRPLVLLFRWTGDWRLTRVFLPADAFGSPTSPTAAATPAPASVPAVAPAASGPPPPGAQRAVLYEEDSSDPNGKSYTGSVMWRADPVPGGSPGEIAVTAQVSVPERPLNLTLTLRRNLDKSLPASHTIDVKFELPPDSSARGILDMIGIMMKPNEEVAGQQLAGTRVKVADNLFLMGLSAIELDIQHNMQVLKDRPWVGIPFVYNSNNRAVLSIEKGTTGEKIIADAIAGWSVKPPAESAAAARR